MYMKRHVNKISAEHCVSPNWALSERDIYTTNIAKSERMAGWVDRLRNDLQFIFLGQ